MKIVIETNQNDPDRIDVELDGTSFLDIFNAVLSVMHDTTRSALSQTPEEQHPDIYNALNIAFSNILDFLEKEYPSVLAFPDEILPTNEGANDEQPSS